MDPLRSSMNYRRAPPGPTPKAVVVVDLYGPIADYGPILEACRQYEVTVIEDAAEAWR